MPACTWLNEDQYTKPTSNAELNSILAEVRRLTGKDWRVAERKFEVPRGWFRKPAIKLLYEVYVETIKPEFQVINFYREWDWSINHHNNVELVVAYLYGILAGFDEAKREITINIPEGVTVGPMFLRQKEAALEAEATPAIQRSTSDPRLVVRQMDNGYDLALYLDEGETGRMLPNQVDLRINSQLDNPPTVTCTFLVDEKVRIEQIPTP